MNTKNYIIYTCKLFINITTFYFCITTEFNNKNLNLLDLKIFVNKYALYQFSIID